MEYRTPTGLSQGYYCQQCGQTTNMLATGHGDGKCVPNPEYVAVLNELNKAGSK